MIFSTFRFEYPSAQSRVCLWHIPALEAYWKVAPLSEQNMHKRGKPWLVVWAVRYKTIGEWRWNSVTQLNVCDTEIEIVTFVVKGSAKLNVPLERWEQIWVESRSVALRRVFDLKVSGIHLTAINRKVWVINGKHVINVSQYIPFRINAEMSHKRGSHLNADYLLENLSHLDHKNVYLLFELKCWFLAIYN